MLKKVKKKKKIISNNEEAKVNLKIIN